LVKYQLNNVILAKQFCCWIRNNWLTDLL